MNDRAEFSVYQFFPDGSCERVASFVGGRDAVEIAFGLTQNASARGGYVRRIITDGGDHAVFEWQHGRGVTHPPPEEAAPHPPEPSSPECSA